MSNLVPVGTYTARAVGEVQFWIAKASGNDYILCAFRLATEDGVAVLSKHFVFSSNTDKNGKSVAERSIESIRFCGWQGSDLSTLAVGKEGFGDADVLVTVEHEQYTDEATGEQRTSAKIGWVNSFGGAKVKDPMNEGQRKAFANKFRGLATKIKPIPIEVRKPAPVQPPKGAGDSWEPPMDDQPPFSDDPPM